MLQKMCVQAAEAVCDHGMESKQGGNSFRDSGADKSDEKTSLVEELVNYLNSTDYNRRIQAFLKQNCREFHDFHARQKSGVGNKLEWTSIHNDYLELVEKELQSFCETNGTETEEVFLSIQQYIESGNGEAEFIPMFLKTTDENYFFEQMYSYANEAAMSDQVEEISANEEKGEESMTGIWQTDPEKFDESELTHWLVALGIPWVFRKLVIRSQRSSSKVLIAHIPNQQFEISTVLPIFGTWTLLVTLNGKWQNNSSRLGDPIRVTGRETADGVNIHLMNTKAGTLTVFTVSFHDEHLLIFRELYVSGVETGSPNATLHTYLLR
jgi:hypothetical protein